MSKTTQDWREIVDSWEASRPGRVNVRVLVHLAMRQDSVDTERVSKEIFREFRHAYESQLTKLAKDNGCKDKQGIADETTLTTMHDQAREESAGITNTYNYDLAHAIDDIRGRFYSPNRNTYAKYLAEWHTARMAWKSPLISLKNVVEWKAKAVADFLKMNAANGVAKLMPSTHAVCDVCKYWIGRGDIPLLEAEKVMEEWPPHPNCIHSFEVKIKKLDCESLWVGKEPTD